MLYSSVTTLFMDRSPPLLIAALQISMNFTEACWGSQSL